MPYIKQILILSLTAASFGFVSGCSDNDDDNIVVTDAGIYRGYMSLSSDEEAAEVEAVIGHNGQSTVSIYASNGKQADKVFRGATTESTSTLTFNDNTADASFSLTLSEGQLTGTFTSSNYNGDVTLDRDDALSSLAASLNSTAGSYAFKDSQQQLWSLTITDEGVINASSAASCSFSGQLTVLNAEINTYGITLGSTTCAPFSETLTGTAYLIAIESANDALRVATAGTSESWDVEWLRL